VVAARPYFIGLSSSTHANITFAAGDVDRHGIVLHCSNLLILSISCCLLWVRVSLLFRFKWHAYKRVSVIHAVFSCIISPSRHVRLLLTLLALSQNGGTNCPACRSISTNVTPSRVLQVMIDILLRADPSRTRTDREKQQADEVYKPGLSFRVRIYSFSMYVTYRAGTSRYQLREKPRQSQRSLKVATMRVPVRTAYPEIASGGNAQTQCPTRRLIRNTPGPWMTAHLQDTLVVETGMPFSPVPFVTDLLNPNRDSPAKTCSQLTRLPRQSATCVKCTFVALACSTAALPSVLQVLTHTE
jgi:hypothetical protein